jgi:hypothetical protein
MPKDQSQKRPNMNGEGVTIHDLLADWRVRRAALDREIAFRESSPGVAQAQSLKTLRRMALELDRLIARYAFHA